MAKENTLIVIVKIRCGCTRDSEPVWVRIRATASIVKTGDKLIATEPCWNCKRTVRVEANNPFRIQCSVESMAGTNHFVRAVFMTEHAEWKRK